MPNDALPLLGLPFLALSKHMIFYSKEPFAGRERERLFEFVRIEKVLELLIGNERVNNGLAQW